MLLTGLWRRVWRRVRGRSLVWISLLSLGVLAGATALIVTTEGLNVKDGIWWAIVTMTTVGYGDISPSTPWGRMVAAVLMVFGIGLLSVLTVTVATQLIEHKSKVERGLKQVKEKGHILLCGWNPTAADVLGNLKADRRSSPVVIIADLERRPVEDHAVGFVQGGVSRETLDLANASQAEGAVVVGDMGVIDPQSRDAKTLITALTIKDYNPEIYVCIELLSEESLKHAAVSRADEVIVSGDLTGGLLSRAAMDHGTSLVVSHLVRTDVSSEFYRLRLPAEWSGMAFSECLLQAKHSHDLLVVAVETTSGDLLINPPVDYRMQPEDTIVVISQERPEI